MQAQIIAANRASRHLHSASGFREVGIRERLGQVLGVWHDVVNTGDGPLRLYSVYGPAEHPHGTIHVTKAEADADEHDHHHSATEHPRALTPEG